MDKVDIFLRLPDVRKLVPVSRATIYRMISDGEFPKQIKLSKNCVGWRLSDVAAWMTERQVSSVLDEANH
jgi:prophage regulatory protein